VAVVGSLGGGAGIGAKWQKPTLQAELLCAYVPVGAVVYDPCAGSGSSLIAAAKHGRTWRGVEMDPVRVDDIRRRWAKSAMTLGEEIGDGIA
jgi:DNA modification methylase